MTVSSNLTKAGSTAFRSKGNVVGLLAFPVLLTLVFALGYRVYPVLSPSMQNAIDNGGLGMMLGMAGGLVLWCGLIASWQSATTLLRGSQA